jgi:hypothetical protein
MTIKNDAWLKVSQGLSTQRTCGFFKLCLATLHLHLHLQEV